jgi:mannose-6-phosphate isomerase-like protein (cupin superfamily)
MSCSDRRHPTRVLRKQTNYRWEDVQELPYKDDARALFKSITRQVLFSEPEMHAELRYFEIAPGGFSTLERHQHMHAVLILRGGGRCLVGEEVKEVRERDLITVPAMTWHQFRPVGEEPLGFLCMVNATRDKPQLPSAEDLARLNESADVRAFLCGQPTRSALPAVDPSP